MLRTTYIYTYIIDTTAFKKKKKIIILSWTGDTLALSGVDTHARAGRVRFIRCTRTSVLSWQPRARTCGRTRCFAYYSARYKTPPPAFSPYRQTCTRVPTLYNNIIKQHATKYYNVIKIVYYVV